MNVQPKRRRDCPKIMMVKAPTYLELREQYPEATCIRRVLRGVGFQGLISVPPEKVH